MKVVPSHKVHKIDCSTEGKSFGQPGRKFAVYLGKCSWPGLKETIQQMTIVEPPYPVRVMNSLSKEMYSGRLRQDLADKIGRLFVGWRWSDGNFRDVALPVEDTSAHVINETVDTFVEGTVIIVNWH